MELRVRLLPQYPFPIMQGGLEIQCLETVSALQKLGIEAKLLDPYSTTDTCDVIHLFGPGLGSIQLLEQLGDRSAVVISALFSAGSASVWRTAAKRSVTIVARMARQRTVFSIMLETFRRASQVITLTALEDSYLSRTYRVPKGRRNIIPNGVREQYFESHPEPFVRTFGFKGFVLFVGTITSRKNPLRLARVLSAMGERGVFVGRPSAENSYVKQFDSVVQGSPNLLWIPHLDRNDPLLPSAYAAAAAFCLPSHAETQSLSALEALAAKTPVILGDSPYAYQPPFENVQRVNPASEESLRAALEQSLGQDRTELFTLPDEYRWDSIARRIVLVYQRALSLT